jgi:hypothetical protein
MRFDRCVDQFNLTSITELDSGLADEIGCESVGK